MIEDLKKLYGWKTITKNRIETLIKLYDFYIKGNESQIWKTCKCDKRLRIMFLDLKKYVVENNI